MRTIFYRSHLWLILLLLISLWIHSELILKDPVLIRDDLSLIQPLFTVTGPIDYFNKLWQGVFFDLQPVRDLSFYFNLILQHFTHYGAFHLTNLVLAYTIVYLFFDILRKKEISPEVAFYICGLLLLHPLFNTSIAWISNRKHILAILFLLLYLREDFKSDPSSFKKFLWASLGLFSQPIIVLILLLYPISNHLLGRKKFKSWDYPSLGVCLSVIGVNQWFYSTKPLFAARNLVDGLNQDIGLYILKIFRVPIQIILPIRFGMEYDSGSVLSFLGIIVGVILFYVFVKKAFTIERFIFGCIALSTLFPVLLWGVRDAYLLTSLLGSFFILARIISQSRRRILGIVAVALIPLYLHASLKFTDMWKSYYTLVKTSHEVEGGIDNSIRYADLIASLNPSQAYEAYSLVLEQYPGLTHHLFYAKRARALFRSLKSNEEKLAEYSKFTDLYTAYYAMRLYQIMGRQADAKHVFLVLDEALKLPMNAKLFRQFLCQDLSEDCSPFNLSAARENP